MTSLWPPRASRSTSDFHNNNPPQELPAGDFFSFSLFPKVPFSGLRSIKPCPQQVDRTPKKEYAKRRHRTSVLCLRLPFLPLPPIRTQFPKRPPPFAKSRRLWRGGIPTQQPGNRPCGKGPTDSSPWDHHAQKWWTHNICPCPPTYVPTTDAGKTFPLHPKRCPKGGRRNGTLRSGYDPEQRHSGMNALTVFKQ